MADYRVLEIDPEVDGRVTVRFHKRLPAGVTLSDPEAVVQERTSTDPETWEDAEGVEVETAAVVNATTDLGVAISGGEDRAVQIIIVDSDSPADPDAPARGKGYRLFVTATRSDAGVITAKNPLHIRP